jgi:hypothetical protein
MRAPRGLGGIIDNFAPVVHRSQRAQLPHHQPQQGERLDAQAAIQVAEYYGELLNILFHAVDFTLAAGVDLLSDSNS